MRVLVGNIPLPSNRFLIDLNTALARQHDVTHDHEQFWDCEGDFDVVHLHFPEYLTFEIQDAYRARQLSDELIRQTEHRLEYWASRAKIVVTRHVLLPHGASEDTQWERMYETIYKYSDGIVHFAPPSINEFKDRYADLAFVHGKPRHHVIPHQNYASLPNRVTRTEARKQLRIREGAKVLLVFGGIRNEAERDLVLRTFRSLQVPKKLLLVSRWREQLASVGWIRLKYWLRDLTRLYYRFHPSFRFNYAFVSEESAQHYLNAADVLFIPRLHVLNSGNITLGMTFGKVVVGPDSWNVGYLLNETGNITFNPDDPATAVAAVHEAMALAEEGSVGPANRERALTDYSPDVCGAEYSRFFKDLQTVRPSI